MLRRQLKRKQTDPQAQSHQHSEVFTGNTLGEDVSDEEEELTAKVLGLEEGENLFKPQIKPKKQTHSTPPKPAWEDEEEAGEQVEGQTAEPHQTQRETNFKAPSSAQLRQKFEKIMGVPSWAKLKWQRDAEKTEKEQDSSEDSDDEGEDEEGKVWRTAMDFSRPDSASDRLPKDTLQYKRCANANKQITTKGAVRSVEFHPSAQVVLTAGADERLNLFQVDGQRNPKIQSVFLEKYPIFSAHFTRDGQEVVMGTMFKCFHYYDMIAGKVTKVPALKGYEENSMSTFKVSPDGRLLVFKGRYGRMHLISSKSKEWIGTLTMNGSVNDFEFSSDGSRMYSIGDDGDVYVWDMNQRCCIHRFFDEGAFKGTAVGISPSNRYLATGSYSGIVNIYKTDDCLSLKSPKPLKVVKNLLSPITQIKFNPTNEMLAIASNYEEKALRMVHIPSFRVFKNFPAFTTGTAKIYSVDFSLNSGYFTAGASTGKAYLYRLQHYEQF